MRWPVCHTPPRVVTHQMAVENPRRTAIHRRVPMVVTPARPASQKARPTSTAAMTELTIGCHVSAWKGPVSQTSGMRAMAGNGANGT